MLKTKYIMSDGLAFSEEKDMQRLSRYAKKGWILEGFAGLGFKLRKEEPKYLDYSLDYLKEADEEYFQYFEAAGWSHVCSSGNEIHVFCAPIGTKPIYSDKETIIEKYQRQKKQMGKYALPFLISWVVFFVLSVLSQNSILSETIGNVSEFFGLIAFIILIFPGLPYIAYHFRLKKLRKSMGHRS
ncbi:DUF2812 domain-containing protein [Bacillus sp. CECT 9360]|uniref:DUF2812 domain-containing protein n=1 Tax=Bacillus sp. CECT 9360 TaxID=2845821 RepID=UPI001E2EA6A1|nr:DUF2812 domain-containing protein [Bacillus sp. CECT 9360]CAH0346575.1 hypothetical protein BCI9360_02914 [Bacillus sp. CECT 9360]